MAVPMAGWAQLFINPPTFPATNTVHVTLSGVGATNAYVIFYTPDLTTSFNSWAPIVTGAVGQTTFDLATTTNTNAFYRAGVAPPFAPAGLSATPTNAQVSLSWTASSGATSYNVKQALVSGGPFTTIATGVTTTNYTNTGLNNGTTYYYVVSAVNASGEGANSSQISATPSGPLSPITGTALNNLVAGQTDVALASGGATDSADSFISGYGPGLAIDGILNTSANPWIPTDYAISGITPDWLVVDFHQTVSLGLIVISGRYTQRAAGTYAFQYTTNASPVTHSSSWTTIGTYTWSSANPLPRTGFQFGTVSNVTGIQLVSAPNTTYNGPWGNSIQEIEAYSTVIPGSPPTGLTATPGNVQVSLSWTAAAGATSYNVKRATVSGGPYTTIATGITTMSYTDTGLNNGTTYYYVVSAVNAAGESGNSSQVSATPSAGATKLAITSVNGGNNPTAGTGFSVVVQAQDSNGNGTNVVADTGVSLSRNTGSGTLGGTLTGTIAAGTSSVTISGVTYTKAESGVSLTATRTSGDILIAGNSASFTLYAGAAAKLAFTTQPGLGTPGTALTTQPAVTLQDANGNTVTGTVQNVTLAIQNNPGGGTLSGTTTVAVNTGTGQATFNGLSIDNSGTGYTLTATGDTVSTTPGLVVSAPFNITTASGGWGPATLITADSDISTTGTLVYAYNWNGSNVTVNGVTFTGTRSVSNVGTDLLLTQGPSPLMCDLPANWISQGIPISQQYQALVGSAAYSDYAGDYFTVQLNNLINGHIYQIQIWSSDSYYDQASTMVSGLVGNSVTLKKDSNNGYGGAGQFTIGTFTASGSSLVLTLTGVGPFVPDKGAMLNALQVRDITE
jgi:fibronectin type 3 domain-containing protein